MAYETQNTGVVNFDLYEPIHSIIKVIGVGGAGGNAVDYMYREGICGAEFVLINTDNAALKSKKADRYIQLGEGLGAGNDAKEGETMALQSLTEIKEMLSQNTKMVFITAGMGGGTGTGAAPVVARVAKELGILTVCVVTVPEVLEGPKRIKQAQEGLRRLKQWTDALIVIDNSKINRIYEMDDFIKAMERGTEILLTAVKGIAEIITLPGYVNVDFADVKTVMSHSGMAVMGSARARGPRRAYDVISNALSSPLLNRNSISGARNILLNITSGKYEITVRELQDITNFVVEQVGRTSAVIWGVGNDPSLNDEINVTIIATGLPMDNVENDFDAVRDEMTPVSAEVEAEIDVRKKEFVKRQSRNTQVVLQPDMDESLLEEIENTPAYQRRTLKVT